MITVSSKSKILDLLLILEQIFQQNQRFQSLSGDVVDTQVLYLEHMSIETLDVAKSHTSWMNFRDNTQFADISKVPFTFNNIKAISTLDEYHQLAYGQGSRLRPLVVVTSLASLQYGFSSQILREFAARDTNEIIMIEKPAKAQQTVANKIFQNQKRFTVLETTYTQQARPLLRQASSVSRKQSIEEVMQEIKHEVSTTIATDVEHPNKRTLKAASKCFHSSKFAMFKLPEPKSLLTLYG